jgi:hypothetical protein
VRKLKILFALPIILFVIILVACNTNIPSANDKVEEADEITQNGEPTDGDDETTPADEPDVDDSDSDDSDDTDDGDDETDETTPADETDVDGTDDSESDDTDDGDDSDDTDDEADDSDKEIIVFADENGTVYLHEDVDWHLDGQYNVGGIVNDRYFYEAIPNEGYYFEKWLLLDKYGAETDRQYLCNFYPRLYATTTANNCGASAIKAVFTNDESKLVDTLQPEIKINSYKTSNNANVTIYAYATKKVAGTTLIARVIADGNTEIVWWAKYINHNYIQGQLYGPDWYIWRDTEMKDLTFGTTEWIEIHIKEINDNSTQGLGYTLIDNGTAYSVTRYTNQVIGGLIIPDTYDGLPVTEISAGAFHQGHLKDITAVYIPSGITAIGESAFENCTNLTSVIFESGSQLMTIGVNAFANCINLTDIILPESVISIGENAFLNVPQ